MLHFYNGEIPVVSQHKWEIPKTNSRNEKFDSYKQKYEWGGEDSF